MRKFNRGEPIGEPKRVLIGNETVGRYVLPRSVLLTFFILFTAQAPPPDIDARIEAW
jgi:hypothetical protein